MKESASWVGNFTMTKYASSNAYAAKQPYEVVNIGKNVLLNEGIQEMLDSLIGSTAAIAYSFANARLGVGASTVTAASTQTGLLSSSGTSFKSCTTGYPTRSSQTMSWKASWGSTSGNFAWNEFTVDNGASRNKNLNRKVSAQGTKASGQTWTLQLDVTIS